MTDIENAHTAGVAVHKGNADSFPSAHHPHDHRSFPEAADGRPFPTMMDELITAGLNGEDARFVAIQLAQNGLALVPAAQDGAKAYADLEQAYVRQGAFATYMLRERNALYAEVERLLGILKDAAKYPGGIGDFARDALRAHEKGGAA